ncbi:MAG: hypothetical protein JSV65_15505 [Armatimonadota bacterium]|nr:MAG: hypothetical protein JSV65_15505 [Armatimonadota bacterium]
MSSIEEQTKHATLLERYEEAMSDLYKEYAGQYAGYESHWRRLAEDEIQHADWVRTLRKRIEDGSVRLSPEHMVTTAQIINALDRAAAEIARAQEGNTSLATAVAVASQLERDMLERNWFRFYDTDSDDLKRVFGSLAGETAKHVDALKKLSDQVGGQGQ